VEDFPDPVEEVAPPEVVVRLLVPEEVLVVPADFPVVVVDGVDFTDVFDVVPVWAVVEVVPLEDGLGAEWLVDVWLLLPAVCEVVVAGLALDACGFAVCAPFFCPYAGTQRPVPIPAHKLSASAAIISLLIIDSSMGTQFLRRASQERRPLAAADR